MGCSCGEGDGLYVPEPMLAAGADSLIQWFNDGAGGAIDWGSHGDFDACVEIAGNHMDDEEAKGFCANRHMDVLGEWPGKGAHGAVTAAATGPFNEKFPSPEYPPREWFERPTWVAEYRAEQGLGADSDAGFLKITVTDDGRVGGWFYEHGQCIIHMPDACPKPSPTMYAAFHQNDVLCADGSMLRVGVIGNTHGHASTWVDWRQAQRTYADPDAQMIVCRAGDDERGGWIAGALVPGLTYGDVALVRRCGLSGDWRPDFGPEWWRQHGVTAAQVRQADGYDCVGPTLVTRPALPLTRGAGITRAASIYFPDGLRAETIDSELEGQVVVAASLGPVAGVRVPIRAYSPDQPRVEGGRFGETDKTATEAAPSNITGAGTVEDPMKGFKSADEALAAIAAGNHVEMDHEMVSVTLEKLAGIAKEAESLGQKAPLYDLCKISVPDSNLFCGESVVASRLEMPQLSGVPTAGSPADLLPKNDKGEADIGNALQSALMAQGVDIQAREIPADQLKASQNELNGAKVAGMMGAIQAGTLPPGAIFVSRDNYVIDGHHRWAANVGSEYVSGQPINMPVVQIDMPIQEVLSYANDFAAQMGLPPQQASLAPRVAASGNLGDDLRAMAQHLAMTQHQTGIKPGPLMSLLDSAAAHADRGDAEQVATKLDLALKMAESIEQQHKSVKGLRDQVQAFVDRLKQPTTGSADVEPRRAYSPDQEREHGRFSGPGEGKSSGGGKGGGGAGKGAGGGKGGGGSSWQNTPSGYSGDGFRHEYNNSRDAHQVVDAAKQIAKDDGVKNSPFGVLTEAGPSHEFYGDASIRYQSGISDSRDQFKEDFNAPRGGRPEGAGGALPTVETHNPQVDALITQAEKQTGVEPLHVGKMFEGNQAVPRSGYVPTVRRAYSPDQPRGESGRFGESDKSGGKSEGDNTAPKFAAGDAVTAHHIDGSPAFHGTIVREVPASENFPFKQGMGHEYEVRIDQPLSPVMADSSGTRTANERDLTPKDESIRPEPGAGGEQSLYDSLGRAARSATESWRAYSPDQTRDEHGRFGEGDKSGGGDKGGGGKVTREDKQQLTESYRQARNAGDGPHGVQRGEKLTVAKDGGGIEVHHFGPGSSYSSGIVPVPKGAEVTYVGQAPAAPGGAVALMTPQFEYQGNTGGWSQSTYGSVSSSWFEPPARASMSADDGGATLRVAGLTIEESDMGTKVTTPDGTEIVYDPATPTPAPARSAAMSADTGLPLADAGTPWDPAAAAEHVAQMTSSDGSGSPDTIDWNGYGKAFFYRDDAMPDGPDAFTMPFADVVDGALVAVPDGVSAAADTLQGGVDVSNKDGDAVKKAIEGYMAQMGTAPPWVTPAKAQASPAQARLQEHLTRTAGPMMDMGGAPGAPDMGGSPDEAGEEDRFAQLEARVSALEEFAAQILDAQQAQLTAALASLEAQVAAEPPLPELST